MKKIYISILSVAIVFVLFTTISYAWITLAKVNSIEGLSLSAVGDQILEISLDGVNYYETMPESEVLPYIDGLAFSDVTSNDGENFSLGISGSNIARANRDYLKLNFHFRTVSRYREIHLVDNISPVVDYENLRELEGTFITSKGVLWQSPINFHYGLHDFISQGDERTFYAKDAMRLSITSENHDSKIIDLSEDPSRGFGKPFGALDYYNKFTGNSVVPPVIKPETLYELSELNVDDEPFANTFDSHVTTLEKSDEVNDDGKPYYKGKASISVWLEGWDADAFDAVLRDRVKLQLLFKSVMSR